MQARKALYVRAFFIFVSFKKNNQYRYQMLYKRILLKLSGESLGGHNQSGINPDNLFAFADEITEVVKLGVQVGVVIGGGNIFRGLQGLNQGVERIRGDYMGMLATIINSMALQSALIKKGIQAEVLGGIAVEPVCQKMYSSRAIELLEKGTVVIISGGTGNPFFTTDSAAALRALEIKADILLKGTRVDGIYSADPEKDKNAVKFDAISFGQAIEKQLKIMDQTAFTLCRENNLPILVFDITQKGNLKKIVEGNKIGSLVTSD